MAVGLCFLLSNAFGLDQNVRQVSMALGGAFAFLGHLFPVWLGFKGGKGVATFMGTLVAASWPLGIGAGLLWLLSAAIFRISSLSALIAASLIAPLGFFIDQPRVFILMAFGMGILIFIRHSDNIKRLLAGTEPRIGQKKLSGDDHGAV